MFYIVNTREKSMETHSKMSLKRFIIINVFCAIVYFVSSLFLIPFIASCGLDFFAFPVGICSLSCSIVLAYLVFIVFVSVCRKLKGNNKLIEFSKNRKISRLIISFVIWTLAVTASVLCVSSKFDGYARFENPRSYILANGQLYNRWGVSVVGVEHKGYFVGADALGRKVLIGLSCDIDHENGKLNNISYHFYDEDGEFIGSIIDTCPCDYDYIWLNDDGERWFYERINNLTGTMVNYSIRDWKLLRAL